MSGFPSHSHDNINVSTNEEHKTNEDDDDDDDDENGNVAALTATNYEHTNITAWGTLSLHVLSF